MRNLPGLLFLIPLTAFANGGQEVGNGGDAVVCRDAGGAVTSAELLDYYEARELRGIIKDLGPPDLAIDAKVALVLDRVARLSPKRAAHYRHQAGEFMSEARFLSGVDLVEVPDSDHLAFPHGCRVEQLAIQKQPEFAEDKRYTINQDIWDKLDGDSRAGLILHEIIYREAFEQGATDSVGARYLHSRLAEASGATLTQPEFVSILNEAHFKFTDIDGWDFMVFGIYFDDRGKVVKAQLQYDNEIQDPMNTGTVTLIDGEVSFYPDGKLQSFQFPNVQNYDGHALVPGSTITVFESGRLSEAFVDHSQAYHSQGPTWFLDVPASAQESDNYVLGLWEDATPRVLSRCHGWANTRDGRRIKVTRVELRADHSFQFGILAAGNEITFRGRSIPLKEGTPFELDDQDVPDSFVPVADITVTVGPHDVVFAAGGVLSLKEGRVVSGTLGADVQLTDAKTGQVQLYAKGVYVVFTTDGKVEHVTSGSKGDAGAILEFTPDGKVRHQNLVLVPPSPAQRQR
jgi:hypothetical protein